MTHESLILIIPQNLKPYQPHDTHSVFFLQSHMRISSEPNMQQQQHHHHHTRFTVTRGGGVAAAVVVVLGTSLCVGVDVEFDGITVSHQHPFLAFTCRLTPSWSLVGSFHLLLISSLPISFSMRISHEVLLCFLLFLCIYV